MPYKCGICGKYHASGELCDWLARPKITTDELGALVNKPVPVKPRYCTEPGCPGHTDGGYCPTRPKPGPPGHGDMVATRS